MFALVHMCDMRKPRHEHRAVGAKSQPSERFRRYQGAALRMPVRNVVGKHLLALLAALLFALPAAAQEAVRVRLTTEVGAIVVELDPRAPVTTANFLRYVDGRRFDGIVFYRAMKLEWGTPPNGLIQTGTQGDPKRVLKPIAHEPTDQTGVLHKAGTLSMARYAPGTATGDFSILLSDLPNLDADPKATDPEARAGYAAFGRVVEGMDVVRRIFDSPVSATKGEGAMRGQMLEPTIRLLTARREPVATTK
jgi:peptidyl-prolyl cis-trans isomerase A (cyclophilin A)